MEITLGLFIAVAAIALVCEYIDASVGGGYGTILTPVLLVVGLAPLDIVPAVLLGQLVGGLVGGYFHHRLGNIHLDFRHDAQLAQEKASWLGYIPRSLDAKVVLILAISGILGGAVGAISAINIPSIVLRIYIGVMVMGVGVLILMRRNHRGSFSFRRVVAVGLLSSFNKGASGGGYGPLVTGGQVVIGREAKNSVGSTTVSETAVCIVGFLSYLFLKGDIDWTLAAATSIGSVMAGPLAAITVKKLESKNLKLVMGVGLSILGAFSLLKTFVWT